MSSFVFNRRTSTLKHPPGPTDNWPTGMMSHFREDSLGTMWRLNRKYGDAVRFRFFLHYHAYLFSHPDHVQHILQSNNRNYTKLPSPANILLKPLVGLGLLTSDGDFWLRQRRLAQPAFHRRRIASFATTMTDAAGEMLERWQGPAAAGQALNVVEEMTRLTLEIAGKTLFSVDLTREADTVGDAFTEASTELMEFLDRPFGPYLVNLSWWPGGRPLRRHLAVLDEVVEAIIEERRRERQAGRGASDDLLDMLMDARDEETGEGMSNKQLRDEVMTLMLAGHETTSLALSWTVYLLSQHPEQRRRLEQEVDEVLGGRQPAMEDMQHLTYTKMVLEESMRLYPPAYALSRWCVEADEVGGYYLPAESAVTLSPYLTHRHPDFWVDPERFNPERFRAEHQAERPRFAYMPFGGGPRQCIGN
ncbi:MAG: cytochrome P450, partial [Chloroflexota bacterium]